MWFKPRNTRPAPVTYDPDYEAAYRAAWGYSLDEWLQLSIDERRLCRDRVTSAPYFTAS